MINAYYTLPAILSHLIDGDVPSRLVGCVIFFPVDVDVADPEGDLAALAQVQVVLAAHDLVVASAVAWSIRFICKTKLDVRGCVRKKVKNKSCP